jgi:hypothetical protein
MFLRTKAEEREGKGGDFVDMTDWYVQYIIYIST